MNSKFFLDSLATPGGSGGDPETISNGLTVDDINDNGPRPVPPVRRQNRSNTPKLKPGCRCVSKLDVTLIRESSGHQPLSLSLSSSRKIGLVTNGTSDDVSAMSTYAFFVWNDNAAEAIIPIDQRFHFQLVPFDPLDPLELTSAGGNDLSLVIHYDGDDGQSNKNLIEEPSILFESKKENSQQSLEEILAEYDPLTRAVTVEKSVIKNSDQSIKRQKRYRFLLPYDEQTQRFVSKLEHIVSESRKLKLGTENFLWTSQYSLTTDIDDFFDKKSFTDRSKSSNIRQSHSSQDISSSSTFKQAIKTIGFEDNFADVLKISNPSGNDQDIMFSKGIMKFQTKIDGIISKIPAKSLLDLERFDSGNNNLNIDPDHFGDDEPSMFADRNREDQIKALTEERESEYVRYEEYSLFIGTWNVNGQYMANPKDFRDHFLAVDKDKDPPDFYAIGFQELDLSKEAFLFNDNKREDYWIQVCQGGLHPKRKYILLKKIRLIGMMLVIFTVREFESHIKNVSAAVVGTGILGKMGNKGGVAIRFDLHDTSICFVNCHLAAHVEQFERRNLDFREINSRLTFWQMNPPRRISDHDQIYWFGDLNYRIMFLNTDQVRMLLDSQKYDILLEHDQLNRQMKEKNCFQGYQEGPIRHLPSYKYNPGTNEWDSSEKRRPPAWCDRILWTGSNIEQINYRSHPELKDSDHKPVSAVFRSRVRVVDHRLKRKVYEDVMKKLDKAENDYLPQVSIDTTEIHFGKVSFRQYGCSRSLSLTNTGQSRFKFKFTNKPNDYTYCKPWLRVTPSAGTIKLRETISITFELNLDDPRIASKLNYGQETLTDTLVLRLIGGKDIFVTVTGDYQPTCFGLSLETLVRLECPVATITVEEIKKRFNQRYRTLELRPSEISAENKDDYPPIMEIPKELFALIDFIYRRKLCHPYLFQCEGLPADFPVIRDALDSCQLKEINEKIDNHSLGEALMLFLMALPEPVIPYYFYSRIKRLNRNHQECRQIYRELPPVHRSIFQYLMMFLQEMCACGLTESSSETVNDQQFNKLWIATNFGPILVRKKSGNDSSSSSSPIIGANINYDQNQYGATSSSSNNGMNLAPEQFFIFYFLNNKSW